MKLSVVIVNYNVKHFIEQCLHSVYKALNDIDSEVFVVDNNSVDGSCIMIQEKFPQVKLIENKSNTGFAVANNQAIKQAQGEYIVLLNPDTVVQEDTFTKCIGFMDSHVDAGALGIKMIDGKGKFLPESKRALPTPAVAFYKIFGFSTLFPKSKIFGRYHLSYLDKDKIHQVEILAGAYMFLRRSVLDKIGFLDETFFMYGEDIDLSYRIIKAGYTNYYFPETTIIHYKGESTKKGSLNYVLVFYKAMQIFAQKHFANNQLKVFTLMLQLAIYFRAVLSLVKRFVKNIYLPLLDGLIIYGGFLEIKRLWEPIQLYNNHYPKTFLLYIMPAYVFVWLASLVFSGTYIRPIKLGNIIKGILIGTLIILAIYGLLPLDLRFSRFLIIMGSIWSIIGLIVFRYILSFLKFKDFKINDFKKKRIIIVGNIDEYLRVKQLLLQTHLNPDILGFIYDSNSNSTEYLGRINQIEDIIAIYKAEEIIFSGKDIAAQEIINQMLVLSRIDIEYKIAPPESLSVIGSNSINTAGDLYLININSIGKASNLRQKRIFDVLAAFFLIITYPVTFLFIRNKLNAFTNIIKVLFGYRSIVGYSNNMNSNNDLPPIKKGILTPADGLTKKEIPLELRLRLDFLYAKDYKFINDFNILLRGLLYIGR
jgi:GT2 family glycosyltransferase